MKLLPILLITTVLFIACGDEGSTNVEPEAVAAIEPSAANATEIQPIPFAEGFRLASVFPADRVEVTPEDSIVIVNVLGYCNAVDRKKRELPQKTFQPEDQRGGIIGLQLMFNGDEIVRGIYTEDTDEMEKRERIYFRNGEMVYYRLRQWNKEVGKGNAFEINCTFVDGKIAKIYENIYDFKADGKPITTSYDNLFINNTRDKKAFQEEIERSWKESLKLAK